MINQKNQRGFANVIVLVVLGLVVAGGGYLAVSKKLKPLAPSVFKNQDKTSSWKTYRNEEYGFEFKYPGNWLVSENKELDFYNRLIVGVVNPDRAGKPDTDTPVEKFYVGLENLTCQGYPVNLGGRVGTQSYWAEGFGEIYYRDLCFSISERTIKIFLSAYDGDAQDILDSMVNTFRFVN